MSSMSSLWNVCTWLEIQCAGKRVIRLFPNPPFGQLLARICLGGKALSNGAPGAKIARCDFRLWLRKLKNTFKKGVLVLRGMLV
jgi:hypothetical protein